MRVGDVTRCRRRLDGRDPARRSWYAAPPAALRPRGVGPRIVIGIG